jgi:RNA polymerase sigma-70 factor (ECF subfamily)
MRDHGGVDGMTDGQLATLAQAGDRAAFGALADRWRRPLERFAGRLLADDEAARDACQEAMLKAWVHIRRLREPDMFKPWLHQIAVNACRDRQRAVRTREPVAAALDDAVAATAAETAPGPVEIAEQRETARRVRTALARLSHEHREAIVLRELEGYTSPEVAAITGVPPATVRSRLFYGLRALRRELERDGTRPDDDDGGRR